MQANLRSLKEVMRRAAPVRLTTLDGIAGAARSGALTPLQFAAGIGDASVGHFRGTLSEDDVTIRLRSLGVDEPVLSRVIANMRARRERRERGGRS